MQMTATMNKRDATRQAIAAVDEAAGRARDAGDPVEALNTLRAALSSGLVTVVEICLKRINDKKAVAAVEGLLSVIR